MILNLEIYTLNHAQVYNYVENKLATTHMLATMHVWLLIDVFPGWLTS